MIEKNNIEKVWFIENNQLINSNKIVSKIQYRGKEIAVLKQDRHSNYEQDYLFKDINNEYWSMNILGIDFRGFTSVEVWRKESSYYEYCNKVIDFITTFDLKDYFEQKIKEQKYFNICELKYISFYYPDLYNDALKSREIVLENNAQKAKALKEKLIKSRNTR